ncbi:MAG: replicative DNA helicase [Anaerolineaceae bacterium]|nr:MAG: replicative DNA helicase [Anaerolineaceae bacterium]
MNPSPDSIFSAEAEEAVLGAVMTSPDSFLNVAAFLNADDFFLLRNKYIWQAIHNLHERREPADLVTVQSELQALGVLKEVGGAPYLMQLVNSTPTSVHGEVYGRIVERLSIRRRLMATADEIRALAANEEMNVEQVASEAEAKLFGVTDRQTKRDFVTMNEAVNEYFNLIEYMMEIDDAKMGVPSGFRDLDALLGGFQRSDLLIFAGRPGMGKCVAEGTLIATADGLKSVESLHPRSGGIPDDSGGMYYPLKIGVHTPTGLQQTAYFYDSGRQPTVKIRTRGGHQLSGTRDHPVLTAGVNGLPTWKPLSRIAAGDRVVVHNPTPTHGADDRPPLTADGAFVWDRVISAADDGVRHCYDLTVPDGRAFIANGIVSHNTSFMLSTAVNMARLGARVAFFTMEMGVQQLIQRMVSMETGISTQNLRKGELTQEQYNRFVEAAGRISNFPIFIDDTPALNPMQVRTKARRLRYEHGIDVIFVDYLQLMNAGGQYQNNRVQEVSYISRAMKELARELNVPLFSAAQLSRAVEQRQDKRPVLSDLRESGCVTGDSRVYLPDESRYVAIRDLAGRTDYRALSLNTATGQLEPQPVTRFFSPGVQPVYRLRTALGREIRATANHKFYTAAGWKRLDALTTADAIALPAYTVPEAGAGDVYWDHVASIQAAGEEAVYDVTVDGNHCYVCNDIIISNSIEQDADIVMFLYRDSVYNEATEFPNQADVIVAKHRNGPTGLVSLYFEERLTKFIDGVTRRVDLGEM